MTRLILGLLSTGIGIASLGYFWGGSAIASPAVLSARLTHPAAFYPATLMSESTPAIPSDPLADTEWLLEDLGGTGVIDNAQTTLHFDSTGRISGQGGCNRYIGRAQRQAVDGAPDSEFTLTIGAIASTKRLCVPALMDQENRYFQALQKAERIKLDGPYLLIDSEGIEAPLRFTRLSAPGRSL